MGSTAVQSAQNSIDPDLHPALAWVEARRKPLTIAGAVVLVLLLVGWYLVESGRRKESQAAAALEQARAMLDAGNLPEASTEFQRIVQVYGGTDAAGQAELGLNQARMLSGQNQLAADELRQYVATNPPADLLSAAQSHLGMALENLAQFPEAAAAYEAAATAARANYVKVDALLAAARAYVAAGAEPKAVETLEGVLKTYSEDTPGVIEAKVRLAELTGGRV